MITTEEYNRAKSIVEQYKEEQKQDESRRWCNVMADIKNTLIRNGFLRENIESIMIDTSGYKACDKLVITKYDSEV